MKKLSRKKRIAALSIILIIAAGSVYTYFQSLIPEGEGGWYILKWVEKPHADGPSQLAKPEDQTKFTLVQSFDMDADNYEDASKDVRVGDVFAYKMKKGEARKGIAKGKLNVIGYRILKYGHLAIVIPNPDKREEMRLFSSQGFKGPNFEETISTLKDHSWDHYRIDKWDRVDVDRLVEFATLSNQKGGKWDGYDFTGMFGLWNSNLKPSDSSKIGKEYICSTVVVAALYYAGLELDAVNRKGITDLVSPKQVVESKGRLIKLPDMKPEIVPVEKK